MYSRPQNREIRIPRNYGGSAFNSARLQEDAPIKEHTKKRSYQSTPTSTPRAEGEQSERQEELLEGNCAEESEKESAREKREVSAAPSIFSPFGALGTEEILLVALALIIFQSGEAPELSLMLLALLFIS